MEYIINQGWALLLIQARHIHFESLQNIEDLRMHYAIDDITGSAFFE